MIGMKKSMIPILIFLLTIAETQLAKSADVAALSSVNISGDVTGDVSVADTLDVDSILNRKPVGSIDDFGFSANYLSGDAFSRYYGVTLDWTHWISRSHWSNGFKATGFKSTRADTGSAKVLNTFGFKIKGLAVTEQSLQIKKDLKNQVAATDQDFSTLRQAIVLGVVFRPFYSKSIWNLDKAIESDFLFSAGVGRAQYSDSEYTLLSIGVGQSFSVSRNSKLKLNLEYLHLPLQSKANIHLLICEFGWIYSSGGSL